MALPPLARLAPFVEGLLVYQWHWRQVSVEIIAHFLWLDVGGRHPAPDACREPAFTSVRLVRAVIQGPEREFPLGVRD